jgi:hypothetical protein
MEFAGNSRLKEFCQQAPSNKHPTNHLSDAMTFLTFIFRKDLVYSDGIG